MPKNPNFKKFKSNPISQLLVILAILLMLLGSFQYATQKDLTAIAPTQLFIIAAVFAVLGIYLKDERV